MIGANFGLLLTAIAWGSMVPLLNLLLPTWDPFFLAMVRYALGAPILILALLLREPGRLKPDGVPWWRLWLLGGIGIGIFAPLYTMGVAHANPVTAVILSAAGPIVATIVAWVSYRVPIERGMLSGILFAVAGGILATYNPDRAGSPFELRGGEVLILASSACWAWYSLAAQRWLKGSSQLRITGVTMVTGSVVLIAVYLIAGWLGAAHLPPALPVLPRDQALFAWMIVISVATGVLLWNYGVRMLGVVVASLFMNLIPVIAILITAVALGTMPTRMQIVGGALVLTGVVQAQIRRLFAGRAIARARPLPGPDAAE